MTHPALLADLYTACTKSISLLTLIPGGGYDECISENQMTKHRLRDEINADIDRFVDLKTEIMKVIDAVPDEVDRCVFERHFLKGKNYTVIGMEMKYNKDYVYKIIIKGSEKIQILENVLCSFMSIIINRSAGKENLLLNFGLKGERVRDYRLDSLEREKFIPHCPVCGREWLL